MEPFGVPVIYNIIRIIVYQDPDGGPVELYGVLGSKCSNIGAFGTKSHSERIICVLRPLEAGSGFAARLWGLGLKSGQLISEPSSV